LAEVSFGASTSWASCVTDSVVAELSTGAIDCGSDAYSVGEVEAGVTGVAEGVGEAAEAVGGTALTDTSVGVGICSGGAVTDANSVTEIVGI
jgi:hypothetical protein